MGSESASENQGTPSGLHDADHTTGRCQFLQANRDPQVIYAVVWRGNRTFAYGPLAADEVSYDLYLDRWHVTQRGEGDPELADHLGAHREEFHDLQEYFRYFGYDSGVASWADNVPVVRRLTTSRDYEFEKVVERLGLNGLARKALWDAALEESVDPTLDSAGDPIYYGDFRLGNWAVDTGSSYGLQINTSDYRFKAWLSFHT